MDNALDLTTNMLKIRAATQDAYTTGAYQEMTFGVYWTSVCWFVIPTMSSQYPNLHTSVFGPTVTAPAPAIVNNPYPLSNCGLYDFSIVWPQQDRAKRFLTFSSTGDVSVTSNEVLDAGTYGFGVVITLVDYPTQSISTGFKVIIDECVIGSITAPSSPIGEIIHIVGSAQSSR